MNIAALARIKQAIEELNKQTNQPDVYMKAQLPPLCGCREGRCESRDIIPHCYPEACPFHHMQNGPMEATLLTHTKKSLEGLVDSIRCT